MNDTILTVRMDTQTRAILERMAEETERSKGAIIRLLIKQAARGSVNLEFVPTQTEQPQVVNHEQL